MGLQEAKTYGGIGSILQLISGAFVIIPLIGWIISPILGLVGLILVILAVKKISEITRDETIYKNYILSIVIIIIGIAIIFAVIGATVGITFLTSHEPRQMMKTMIGGAVVLVASIILFWILLIVATLYLKKSFDAIAKHTKVGLFSTTGLLYLIGAVLVIAFGLGGIIMFIASILEIVSFFSLPVELPKEA